MLTIESYPVAPDRLLEVAEQLRNQFAQDRRVRIVADQRTAQLLVFAPQNIHTAISEQLKTSGADQPIAASAMREVPIRHVTWRRLEQSISALPVRSLGVKKTGDSEIATFMFEPAGRSAIRLDVDRTNKKVVITGPRTAAEGWQSVVQMLDRAPRPEGDVTRAVSLSHSSRTNVRRAVTAIENGTAIPIPGRGSVTDGTRWSGRFIARLFQDPEAPARDPNVGNNQPGAGDTKNGDAEAAQDAPGADGDAQPQGDGEVRPPEPGAEEENPIGGGLLGPVRIEYLEEFNLFIVTGHPRDVQRVLEIIEEIERQSQLTRPKIVVHMLKNAGSEAMAEIVNRIYSEVLLSREGRVNITPLTKPNALLLVGQEESVQSVIDLTDQLDTPIPPDSQMEVFQIEYASAMAVRPMIEQFFTGRLNLGPRVLVAADYRTNSLIVYASPRDMEEVRYMIGRIDQERASAANIMRVFKLYNSLAEELAPVIQTALRGPELPAPQPVGVAGAAQAGAAGGAQELQTQQALQARSVVMRLLTINESGQRQISSGILTDVRITPDARGNALVVTAPARSMSLIEALIHELDRLPPTEAQVKVFTIVNGDAQQLSEMLETLFGVGQGAAGAQPGQLAIATAGAGQDGTTLVPIRLAIDMRTNSVLVSGSAGDLNLVEAILLKLDNADIRDRKTQVYRLKNAPATSVADAINQFLTSQREVQQIQPGLTTPFQQLEQEVIVVPEAVSNSLILSATPRYFKEMEDLIQDLDKRPPMVMIQVVIAEVALDHLKETGVEFGLQDQILFERSMGAMGLDPGFLFNSSSLGNNDVGDANIVGGQGLSNFAVGRTNPTLGYGGLVLSAHSEAVSVLLRALEQNTTVHVLSRPQIMTLDNQPAFVQVGSRVRLISGSTVTAGGVVQNNVDEEDVGLILGVTPRISPDGLVVMEIDAENSRVGPENEGTPVSIDQFGNVIRSPQIEVVTAQTTVSALDGQTVILGGLIVTRNATVQRRVPVIGSIPLLGRLFRFDNEENVRAELLFIMTPHIVRDEADNALVREIESARMSWCLEDVEAMHGGYPKPLGLVQGGGTPVIYPDAQPGASDLLNVPEHMIPGFMRPGVEEIPSRPAPATPAPNPPAGSSSSSSRETDGALRAAERSVERATYREEPPRRFFDDRRITRLPTEP